jgi:hypothetical protein
MRLPHVTYGKLGTVQSRPLRASRANDLKPASW